jgi:phosphoglycerate kinase
MIQELKKINNLNGKRVLLRVDFNLPVKDGEVASGSDWRIRSVIPTLEYLSGAGAKIIILSHLGRPKGKDLRYSLYPIFLKLKSLWGNDRLFFSPDIFGSDAENQIKKINDGHAVMLENLRFYEGEENGDDDFAKRISEYGDVFVNDAFAASHRAHASITGIPKFLDSYAGFLMEKEIAMLSAVRDKPRRPLVLVMGGAKAETKLKLVGAFSKKTDATLLGGILANTILHSRGINVGQSFTEEKLVKDAKLLALNHVSVPIDVLVSKSISLPLDTRICKTSEVKKDEFIVDIGPETIDRFAKEIKSARMVVWNGALGLTEIPAFKKGSLEIAREICKIPGEKIIGGGDLINFLSEENIINKMSYVSTGGGAMLEFLAGETLPGIEALKS